MSLRVGFGYDVHRVKAGRPLILGGVHFESDWGLDGHSDADVLLHSIADALLGAVGEGDLGEHFPPGDPQWKDASSLSLLTRVGRIVTQKGARVSNIDAMLIAEVPKLAPHRVQMCSNIAAALGIEADRVSVKATTNETLGAIGRREGLAAMSVVLVDKP